MKNGVLAVITLGALLASVFGLSACTEKEPEWKVNGFFKYTEIKYEEDGVTKEGICIVKLTDEGGEQEIIYIPTEIDGKPVVKVGMLDERSALTMGNDPSYYSLPKKTKRVYIPWQISNISPGSFQKDGTLWLFVPNANPKVEKASLYGHDGPIVIKFKKFENYGAWDADTIYKFNYENAPNDGCFMVDNFKSGEKLIDHPMKPERNGYIFTGWFKDSECNNVWDFENDTKGDEDLILYAKWIKK